MASWQNSSGKENHKSLFENVSHDRCIFCGGDRTEIARTDFTIYFSEFEYSTGSICKPLILEYPISIIMASWQNSSGKENHKSLFENVSHDRCIFCGGDRTEIARTDFTIYFSEFEYSTGSICKSCYHANAKQVKAV